MADVTGDGKADLIGFGDAGVWISVTGGSGAKLVLNNSASTRAGACSPSPLPGRSEWQIGKADIIGFGDAGVWVAMSNGDGTFQPATFMLADFGFHAGPVVQKSRSTSIPTTMI